MSRVSGSWRMRSASSRWYSNLLDNALKCTPGGGRVRVSVRAEGATAVLEIADTGVGMLADLIDRVFDPFVQGDRALDRSQGGLGLGLTLVKAIVDGHGGEITARSDGPGRGSVFLVRLPRILRPSAGTSRWHRAPPARRAVAFCSSRTTRTRRACCPRFSRLLGTR